MDPLSMLFSLSLVLLGGVLGWYLNKIQNKQTSKESESKQVKQIIQSLIQELDFNFSVLEKGMSTKKSLTGKEYEWFRGSLQSKSYESIVNSGNLTLLPPEMQTVVSFYYEKLEELNFTGNSTMPNPMGNPSISVSYQKDLVAGLKESYPEIKKALEMACDEM